MPTYEMPILFRVMPKADTVAALKRIAGVIFKEKGFIRKIDNLGRKPLPFKVAKHGKKFFESQNFILHFDVPPSVLSNINDEFARDIDVIKRQIYQTKEPSNYVCQLHEETQPAAYREDVKKLMDLAKRRALRDNFKHKYFKDLKDFPFQT